MSMTARERILTLLSGKRPDRVPWFGDLDYLAYAMTVRGEREKNFRSSDEYIDWHRELGVGFYLQGHSPFKTIIENCEIREWREGDDRSREGGDRSREGDDRFREIETPHGTLRECWSYRDETFSEAPVEYLMKSADDIPAMRFIYENTRYEADYDYAVRRKAAIGDQGILLCYVPKSPFMQLVVLEAGIEAVTMSALLEAEAFDSLIEVMDDAHCRAAEIALNSTAEALMIPENLSAEMIGPRFFEQYMRGYQEKWIGKIRDAGKYSFIHMDGSLKGLLKEECSTGISVLEALTPDPVGDVAIEDFAEYAGDSKSVLWGGMPGVFFTDNVSDEDFEAHTRRMLDVMKREPRYVLGVADQVPPDAMLSRVKRVAEIVEEYGAYEALGREKI